MSCVVLISTVSGNQVVEVHQVIDEFNVEISVLVKKIFALRRVRRCTEVNKIAQTV